MIAQTKYDGTSFGEPNVVQPDVAEPRYIDPHLVPSIAFDAEASDRNGGPLEGKNDKAEIAALTTQVREAIDEKGRAAGRKLRNRIILINAVAWIVIAVVVRLIFF